MEYIVHTRLKDRAICGDVNIPAMTTAECVNGIIAIDNRAICVDTSQTAFDHFARNDDGDGMERGKLTKAIIKALHTYKDPRTDKVYCERWDRVWKDDLCRQYKNREHADHWIWDSSFYNAPITDLAYIARLVGAKR